MTSNKILQFKLAAKQEVLKSSSKARDVHHEKYEHYPTSTIKDTINYISDFIDLSSPKLLSMSAAQRLSYEYDKLPANAIELLLIPSSQPPTTTSSLSTPSATTTTANFSCKNTNIIDDAADNYNCDENEPPLNPVQLKLRSSRSAHRRHRTLRSAQQNSAATSSVVTIDNISSPTSDELWMSEASTNTGGGSGSSGHENRRKREILNQIQNQENQENIRKVRQTSEKHNISYHSKNHAFQIIRYEKSSGKRVVRSFSIKCRGVKKAIGLALQLQDEWDHDGNTLEAVTGPYGNFRNHQLQQQLNAAIASARGGNSSSQSQ